MVLHGDQPASRSSALLFPATENKNKSRIAKVNNEGRKYLINDPLNTFYLCGVGQIMVKDHSDSQRKPASITGATLYN